MLIKPTSPIQIRSKNNTKHTKKSEYEKKLQCCSHSIYLFLSYIDIHEHNKHNTRIHIHKKTYEEEETPKTIPNNTQNYYLNTIKGNKFMFLHCLYKTNKEEKKKPNKSVRCFILLLRS